MQSHKKIPFDDKNILETAKQILKKDVCDNCLGRQFAMVSTGLTNKERGEKIRGFLKTKNIPKEGPKSTKSISNSGYCEICDDLFKDLEEIADKTIDRLKPIEFNTFVCGTKMTHEFTLREETLWEEVEIEFCEPLKSELNRELGKLILKKLKKLKPKADFEAENPDVVILLDLENRDTRIDINPLFVYGKYKKLVRGLPQTKWETYKETVEDIIAKPFMKEADGREHAFHGMGREDIDARCLDWRPFVFEVTKPRKRDIDLKKMEKEVNKSKKVQISDLKFSSKEEVREVKAAKPDKSYRILVTFEKPVTEKDLEKLKKLKGKTIKQQTPNRVLHRRADKTRPRKVKEISWKILKKPKGSKQVEFEVRGEAGLYVKELMHGDQGRTKPSVAEILENPAKVEELDVIKIWVKK